MCEMIRVNICGVVPSILTPSQLRWNTGNHVIEYDLGSSFDSQTQAEFLLVFLNMSRPTPKCQKSILYPALQHVNSESRTPMSDGYLQSAVSNVRIDNLGQRK
jgi:hypothetical protein